MNQPVTMTPPQDSSEWEDEIDIQAYLMPLWVYKWSIVRFIVLGFVIAVSVTFFLTPIYKSTGTIELIDEPNVISIENVDTTSQSQSDSSARYFLTQVEILKSRALSEQVIQRLKLNQHPEFDIKAKTKTLELSIPSWFPAEWDFLSIPSWFPVRWELPEWVPIGNSTPMAPLTENAKVQALVAIYIDKLSINPVAQSSVVELSFEANDAPLAADIVNTHFEIYIENDREERRKASQEALQQLRGQIEELQEKQHASENALQAYREKRGLVDIDASRMRDRLDRQITELIRQEFAAQTRFEDAEALYTQLITLQKESLRSLESLQIVQSNSDFARLKAREEELASNLLQRSKLLGSGHRIIDSLRSALQKAQKQTDNQISLIVERSKRDYEVAQSKYEFAKNKLISAEKEMQNISRQEFELARLTRDVDENRRIYELFQNRIKEINASSEIQSAHARIIDRAMMANFPYKPKKNLIWPAGAFAGFAFGVILAFLRGYLNRTLKNVEHIEDRLNVSLLGYLPELKLNWRDRKTGLSPKYFSNNPKSAFAEAVRSICTGVLLDDQGATACRVIVVTSSIPGEGKSTLSLNLALGLSMNAKVLLIDADLRKPSLAQMCGLNKTTAGLLQSIEEEHDISQCIHAIKDSAVSLMPSGGIPRDPLRLLSSNKCAANLEQLKEKYDFIIIDSPPLLAVSDTLILAKYANEVIFVAHAENVPLKKVRAGIKQMLKARIPLKGLVLNHVNTKYHPDYKYYGYGN